MKYIEFLGLPGSGKTTFAKKTATILRARQKHVLTKFEARKAVIQSIIRENPGILWSFVKISALCLGYRMWNFLWEKYRYGIALNFLREHPQLVQHLVEYANSFASPPWLPPEAMSKESLLQWVFDAATQYQACQQFLNDDDVVLQEEGFYQQAYYLIVAFRKPVIEDHILEQYLQLIPKPQVIMLITTTPEQCEERMQKRAKGVSSDILRLMSATERVALLEQRLNIYEKIANYLESRGVDVIRLDNENYSESLQVLEEKLTHF